MEIIVTLLVILIIIIIIFINFIKFSNFKNELMRALAKEGLPYKKGNNLYTLHAKLVAKLHREGLSPEDIAKGLVSSINVLPDEVLPDDGIKKIIKELYELSGKLASKLNEDRAYVGFNAFSAIEFGREIAAFSISIKEHYGTVFEEKSVGAEVLNAIQNDDFIFMGIAEKKVVSEIRGLSKDNAAGLVFYLFWPELHSKILESKI